MATLLFTAIGTLVGGPVGGAIGSLVGSQVDAAILGGPRREGPRLKELSVTTSSYGTPIPRHFGRMRVPGTIVWATDLVEHRDRQGGGKGRPKVTTYSYSASFAVALSSRPILRLGRIWADGTLLRGAGGDLKAAGALRLYRGTHDQRPDPLIAAAEGAARCPAFRGLAYAVFEDLQLADFGNRIPALTFEVFADEGPLDLSLLLEEAAVPLPEPAVSVADGDFGGPTGFARKRLSPPEDPLQVLRYYDLDRDYQPGLQRAPGRPAPGQPRAIDLPGALSATDARALAAQAARRAGWARETMAWRTATLDARVAPGAIVTLPDQPGRWRVTDWEWRETGVELALARLPPAGEAAPVVADPGRANPAPDHAFGQTALAAFELPWDGIGDGETPALFAAVSAPGPGWSGAALFAEQDGELVPLGPSGRARSIMGAAVDVLPPASPLLLDRTSRVTVDLIAADLPLTDATQRQLAMGANRALLGGELIQFARAVPLGGQRWRLEHLLRGRGGSEGAVGSHAAGEAFVLLDGTPVPLDPALTGNRIAAVGLGDTEPATAPVTGRGATLRPLSPVHPRLTRRADGALSLGWTRRARGAWLWPDAVDTPLREQAEAWRVTCGDLAWDLAEPRLQLTAPQAAALPPGEAFQVRQRGTHALSDPLTIPVS